MAQQSLTPNWGHRLRLKKDPKVSLALRLPPQGLNTSSFSCDCYEWL